MKGPMDSIFWWEKRRVIFNLVVLAAGIATLVLLELFLRFYAGDDFFRAGFDTPNHLLQHHLVHRHQEHRRVIRPEQHPMPRCHFRGYPF